MDPLQASEHSSAVALLPSREQNQEQEWVQWPPCVGGVRTGAVLRTQSEPQAVFSLFLCVLPTKKFVWGFSTMEKSIYLS